MLIRAAVLSAAPVLLRIASTQCAVIARHELPGGPLRPGDFVERSPLASDER
ncbi:MAG TPA: hypothetical protein VKQ30_25830 [Ktedonobacterales bacterium]|nr:hypothetical protein [Ktedonobacterales bacterium]